MEFSVLYGSVSPEIRSIMDWLKHAGHLKPQDQVRRFEAIAELYPELEESGRAHLFETSVIRVAYNAMSEASSSIAERLCKETGPWEEAPHLEGLLACGFLQERPGRAGWWEMPKSVREYLQKEMGTIDLDLDPTVVQPCPITKRPLPPP